MCVCVCMCACVWPIMVLKLLLLLLLWLLLLLLSHTCYCFCCWLLHKVLHTWLKTEFNFFLLYSIKKLFFQLEMWQEYLFFASALFTIIKFQFCFSFSLQLIDDLSRVDYRPCFLFKHKKQKNKKKWWILMRQTIKWDKLNGIMSPVRASRQPKSIKINQ